METATGTKLKREKGEGLNSIKTINKGSTKAATPQQLDSWQCSGGKGDTQEHSGVCEVLGPHGEKRFHCWKDVWGRRLKPPGPSRPQKAATFVGAGARLLRVKPGVRCVLQFSMVSEMLRLYYLAIFWGDGLAPGRSLRAPATAGSSGHF